MFLKVLCKLLLFVTYEQQPCVKFSETQLTKLLTILRMILTKQFSGPKKLRKSYCVSAKAPDECKIVKAENILKFYLLTDDAFSK